MLSLILGGVLREIFKIQVCFVLRKSNFDLCCQKWPARTVTVKRHNWAMGYILGVRIYMWPNNNLGVSRRSHRISRRNIYSRLSKAETPIPTEFGLSMGDIGTTQLSYRTGVCQIQAWVSQKLPHGSSRDSSWWSRLFSMWFRYTRNCSKRHFRSFSCKCLFWGSNIFWTGVELGCPRGSFLAIMCGNLPKTLWFFACL